jgi:H+/gluconate symporter-like permease
MPDCVSNIPCEEAVGIYGVTLAIIFICFVLALTWFLKESNPSARVKNEEDQASQEKYKLEASFFILLFLIVTSVIAIGVNLYSYHLFKSGHHKFPLDDKITCKLTCAVQIGQSLTALTGALASMVGLSVRIHYRAKN